MSDYTVRKTPCPTCPYRLGVESGIWAESEYEKLRSYDGDVPEQVMAGGIPLFMCHQAQAKPEETTELCAGWVGHKPYPQDLVALRLHAHELDSSVWDYQTRVPLFESGQAAAEHGTREIEQPSLKAQRAVAKSIRKRQP